MTRPRRVCECGHAEGDHAYARGASVLAEQRGGACYEPGCGCQEFMWAPDPEDPEFGVRAALAAQDRRYRRCA